MIVICFMLLFIQTLRSQSVLFMMHSALSSSPGGETGFDRLALGFDSVVPALFQALRDELDVLTRLAEPYTVLGFLNAAYLSTVARELTSLLERECETALRDNTTLSSKIKKYSARSRATVGKWLIVSNKKSCHVLFLLIFLDVFLRLSTIFPHSLLLIVTQQNISCLLILLIFAFLLV